MNIPENLQFEELYVVSDLHFGGKAGFQIFASTDEFVWLLEHLSDLAKTKRVAFAINGDFVDFLAEEPSKHFDPDGATKKLDRIVSDPSFKPIFNALASFLNTQNASLLINLGNHDLEMALPWVRERLTEILCKEIAAAKARITWCLDGTGLLCKVGCAEVLLLHGNEFDGWNATDYHHLRKLIRDYNFGVPVEAWKPNAGSRMVVELMNDIKRDYPFVDLLKPEVEGVAKALPFLRASLGGGFDAAKFKAIAAKDKQRIAADLLASDQESAYFTAPNLSEEEFLAKLERGETDDTPSDLLGFIDAAIGWASRESKQEVLRRAIKEVGSDKSFELNDTDDTYKAATAKVGSAIPFLVTGHTHLLRAIPRHKGAYFNSGTWARLIRVDPKYVVDEKAFEPIYKVMIAKTLVELDAAEGADGEKLVEKQCPVVRIAVEGGRVYGEIKRVLVKKTFETMENTRYVAS